MLEPSLPVQTVSCDVDNPHWYAMPGAPRLSSSPYSEASPGFSNGRLNRSGSVDSLDDRSSTSSGGGGSCGTKQISNENLEFIPTRSTKLTPPKPAYNPMQFVKVGPAKLHQTAREQIAQAEKVKKMQTTIKEEEDWQSNLDSWKFSRRKRQEHVIVKLQEVKRLEEETHDRSRKKSKTFSEILQHRTRQGRGFGIPTYGNEDAEDWGDDDGQTKSEPESGIGSEGDIKDRKFIEDGEVYEETTSKHSNGIYSSVEPEYTYEKAIENYRQYAETHSSKMRSLKIDTNVSNGYGTHSPLNGKLSGDSGTSCSETSDCTDDLEFHRKRVEEISQQMDICRSPSVENGSRARRKSLEVSEALKEKISSMQKLQDNVKIENKTAFPERDQNFHRKLEGFQTGRSLEAKSPTKTTPERDTGFRDKLKSFSRIENGLNSCVKSPSESKIVPERSTNFRDKLSSFESLKCEDPIVSTDPQKRGFERTQSLSRLADPNQSAPLSPTEYVQKGNSTPFLDVDLKKENKHPDDDVITKTETRKILPSVSFDSLAKLEASGVKMRPRPVNPLPKPSLKHRRTVVEVVEKTEIVRDEESASSSDDEDLTRHDLTDQNTVLFEHLKTPSDDIVSRVEAIPSFTRLDTLSSPAKKEENLSSEVPVSFSSDTSICDKPKLSSPNFLLKDTSRQDDYRTLVYSSNPSKLTVNEVMTPLSSTKSDSQVTSLTAPKEVSAFNFPSVTPSQNTVAVKPISSLKSKTAEITPITPLLSKNPSLTMKIDSQSKWEVSPNLLSSTIEDLSPKALLDIKFDDTSTNLILGDTISQLPILEIDALRGTAKEPPKEKPPPPPAESDSEILETEGDPVLRRMGSTQRLKKDLRRRRSNFLGLDEEEDPKLEDILPPPPDVKALMHEEIKFQKEKEKELLSQRALARAEQAALEAPNHSRGSIGERAPERTWESVKLEQASLLDGQLSPEDEEILREERKIIEALEKEEQLQMQRRTEYENYRIARLEAERRNMVADKSRREEQQLQQREMDPAPILPCVETSQSLKEQSYSNTAIPNAVTNHYVQPVSKPIPPDGIYGPVIAQTGPPRPTRNAPPAPPVKPRRSLPRAPQEIIYSNSSVINGTYGPRPSDPENKYDAKFIPRKKPEATPKKSDYKNHWLIQEAEQRRITEFQEREHGQRGNKPYLSPTTSNPSTFHSSEKALPETVIQTLTQRVQTKMNHPPSYPYEVSSPVYENLPGNYVESKEKLPPGGHPMYNAYVNGAPDNPNQLLSVSGRKRCSLCAQELGRGAAMIIESLHLFYHIQCFKCCVCNTQLGNGTMGADVRVRNNKLHCQNCYSNEDGVKFSRV